MKTAEIALEERSSTALQNKPSRNLASRRVRWRHAAWAYAMISPLMLGLLIFYIWPVFQTFYFSFTKWGAFGKYKWIGTGNYERLFVDTELWKALGNTFLFTVLSVPGSIALSILVAVSLNQKIRGVGFFRTLYFLPAVTMPVAIAVVWRWLFNGDYGLINYALSLFGVQGPRWVVDPRFAMYALIVIAIWSSIGSNMVLFLAGLQSIPKTYYEAATLDGAGPVRIFFGITLPLLSPSIFFSTIMEMIKAFQMFDLIFLIFERRSLALEATQTVVYLFYKNAFLTENKGYAAAIAVFLFVIILIVTAIQFNLQKRWVHYASEG